MNVLGVPVGMGLLAAHLFLKAQMGYTLKPRGAGFYVASTLPLLARITGPDAAGSE